MAFNAQLPATLFYTKSDRSGTTAYADVSCYSFLEKTSGITNPITLRHDILYPNAVAAIRESSENQPHISSENVRIHAEGCKGHQIDNDFPFEPTTPFAIPLVMYPTNTKGTMLHEVDLCAQPVLNWEGYIQDIRFSNPIQNKITKGEMGEYAAGRAECENSETDSEDDPVPATSTRRGNGRRNKKQKKLRKKDEMQKLLISLNENRKTVIKADEYPEERKKRYATEVWNWKKKNPTTENIPRKPLRNPGPVPESLENVKLLEFRPVDESNRKMPLRNYVKVKNLPDFKLESSWNYLFGGHNGACCYLYQKSSMKNFLFSGKGSQLRCTRLDKCDQPVKPSIFSYTLNSVWEEPFRPVPYNCFAKDKNPLNDVVLQIVPNEHKDLLGVRRGKSVQIYSIEGEVPYILENIPNLYYGTAEAGPSAYQERVMVKDPMITGVTFNPKYSPEVVTADENGVIRICDIHDEDTVSLYRVEKDFSKERRFHKTPKGYPFLHLNEASGVTYSSLAHLFLGWKDSIVSICDRRSPTNACMDKVMDLRKNDYLMALSDQSIFPNRNAGTSKQTLLNEFISCVRASKNPDTYYYVGTNSKLYTMDLRVPNRPIFRVNHYLQSAMTYIDTYSDDNFDMIIGGSQRFAETFCMLTDRTHTLCIDRPGCTNDSPVLFCYPRHLSNQRSFFDATVKEGYSFSLPTDHEMAKAHCYAWPTGLAVIPPLVLSKDFKKPRGFLVATSNNFGDIFLQEWNQNPSRDKVDQSSTKLRDFMKNWKDSMSLTFSSRPIPKLSKNPFKPFDVSLVVEPAAKEIEKLPRVRSKPFNCFIPNALQFEDNQRTMMPMEDLLHKLKWFKNERVKGIVNVWAEDKKTQDETNQAEPVPEIKVEPDEINESISSLSLHTINIDVSEREDEELEEEDSAEEDVEHGFESSQQFHPETSQSPTNIFGELEGRGFAEDSFLKSLSKIGEDSDSQDMFAHVGRADQVNDLDQEASQFQLPQEQSMFEDSQDLFSGFEAQSPSSSQQLSFGSQTQSTQLRKVAKSRKSGFL